MKIIFVHGMCATGESWNDLHVALTKEFKKPNDGGPTFIEPLTLPGVDPAEKIGLEEMMAQAVYNDSEKDMSDWVEHVASAFPPGSDRDVCLIGHSQGGAVISHVADAQPGRISRLIYVAAMLPASGQTARQIVDEAQTMSNPELALADLARLVKVGGLVRQPEAPTNARLTLETAARDLDRCFLFAEHDGVLPYDLQKQMVEAYTDDGMAITIESLATGHLPQLQDRDALVAKLKKWIPGSI